MTTQPVGTARVLARRVTGCPGQPVTWSSSRTSMTPFAVHPALITASCPAQVRTWPDSVMLSWVSVSHRCRRGPLQIPESRRDPAFWSGEL